MDPRRDKRCHRCGTRLAHDNSGGYCAPCKVASRDRFAASPEVPADFWDNEAIREALACRHMGRVIRAYRCHPFHGRRPLPQEVVAGWIGVTQGQLSHIETGPPIVHLDRLIHWARLLRIPPGCLWFALPEDSATRPGGLLLPTARQPAHALGDVGIPLWWGAVDVVDASLWWAPGDTVEIVSQFSGRDLTLDRRGATFTLAGVVFGSTLLDPLERWLSDLDERPSLSSPGERSAAGRRGAIGYQEVEQIENAARVFRDWDDRFGGGLRRKAVVGQLNEVADLLRGSHPQEIRRRLFRTMAQLSETAAIMSWDCGDQALAQRYYVLGLRACKPADDRSFAANIMAGMARQLLYLGHVNDALELVRLAQENSAGHATAAVRSMLHTREAWAYSKLGRISAFRRATAKAEDALADARPAEEPHWISYFDRAELEGTTGGRLLELAHERPELAEETAERINQAIALRRPGRLRSFALDQIGLAEARLIQGEMEEASRLGHAAAAVVEQTPSDRVRVQLAEFYQHSNTFDNVPAIANLRDRIRPLLSSQPA